MPIDQPQEGAVAVLDVLGFAERASLLPALKARARFLDPVFKAMLDAEHLINRDLAKFAKYDTPTRLDFVSFADTVVLLLPRTTTGFFSEGNNLVESLAYACAIITTTCMWLDVPLRGAIAYGETLFQRPSVRPWSASFRSAQAGKRAGMGRCRSL
jgi:hypothetical protein